MSNPELEATLQKLRQLFAAEYARGQNDAISRIVQAAQDAPASNGHDVAEAVDRAPRGSIDAFIKRVLTERATTGAGAQEILSAAQTRVEKMASYSGIRFALDRGRKKGLYRNKNGRWFLAS
jgi:hypothetical protein